MITLNFSGINRNPRFDYVYQGTTLMAEFSVGAGESYPNGAIFEWIVDGRTVGNGSSQYQLTQADAGKTVTVRALLPDAQGQHTIVVDSATTRAVFDVNDPATGALTIVPPEGERVAGTVLSLQGSFTDPDGMGPLGYQWLADGQAIPGATGATYTLTAADAGKTIVAAVSYVDGLGVASQFRTDTGAFVANVDAAVVVDGELAPGSTLYASVRDPNGTSTSTIHYAWDVADAQGNWTTLAGATADELAIGAAAPAVVRVFADYANDAGFVKTAITTVGTAGADFIQATWTGEKVYAGAGDDVIRAAFGTNYYIDGGAGLDTYVAATANTVIYREAAGSARWYVNDTMSRSIALLNDVERVRLQNGEGRALDIDGAGGQAFRLYTAAFDRAADLAGLGFWIGRLDAGTSLRDVANAFVASQEFHDVYGANPGNAGIVDKLYQHVLHRAPDAASRFWVDALDSGAATVADVLVGFSESAENVAQLVGEVQYGIAYTPYA